MGRPKNPEPCVSKALYLPVELVNAAQLCADLEGRNLSQYVAEAMREKVTADEPAR